MYFQGIQLLSSIFKGLEFLIPISSIFKDFSRMLEQANMNHDPYRQVHLQYISYSGLFHPVLLTILAKSTTNIDTDTFQ